MTQQFLDGADVVADKPSHGLVLDLARESSGLVADELVKMVLGLLVT
jgi:hypothetical protein